jgi:hypothetical protein
MSSTNPVCQTHSHRRRRVAAGALAVGASSFLAAIGFASPATAGTPNPSVAVQCTANDASTGTSVLIINNFPYPNQSLSGFVIVRAANGSTTVYNGISLATDGFGSAMSAGVSGPLVHDEYSLQAAIFRDTNGNARWDPDTDDTLFRSVAVTVPANACQSETLSPK